MKRVVFTLAVGLAFAASAIPQELPPGVLLLSRVKQHTKDELQRLANITCLETVEREHRPPGGKLRPLDTVTLEVLYDGHKELYASPGDRKLSEGHPIQYAGSGLLGNGFFGLYLNDILVTGNVSYEYKGEEHIGGRTLARYDYRLPLMWSGQVIRLPEGSGEVGLHGSFWADPQTYDVIRLKIAAEDIPPSLPLIKAETAIEYARTNMGDRSVLLPQSAELEMAKFSGELDRNRIEFTHCRAFGAQTAIRFDAPDAADEEPRFGIASIDDTLRPLPAGIEIPVTLLTRITGGLPVGALIDAAVADDVREKRSILVARGSPVRGRIRRLERYGNPFPHFVVALEFTEVEFEGIRYRFLADLEGIGGAAGVTETLLTPNKVFVEAPDAVGATLKRTVGEILTLPKLPGVASFFVKGAKLDLPPGFRTTWKTRLPAR